MAVVSSYEFEFSIKRRVVQSSIGYDYEMPVNVMRGTNAAGDCITVEQGAAFTDEQCELFRKLAASLKSDEAP